MKLWSAAIMLFLIMDPLGNVPLFLATLKHLSSRRRRRIILRELLIAYGVMLLFLFFGQGMLDALQLKQESISIAGGIILFLIALKMIFPPEAEKREKDEEAAESEPFIVPLAIPLVAGPSLLAALLLLVSREPHRMLEWWGGHDGGLGGLRGDPALQLRPAPAPAGAGARGPGAAHGHDARDHVRADVSERAGGVPGASEMSYFSSLNWGR